MGYEVCECVVRCEVVKFKKVWDRDARCEVRGVKHTQRCEECIQEREVKALRILELRGWWS